MIALVESDGWTRVVRRVRRNVLAFGLWGVKAVGRPAWDVLLDPQENAAAAYNLWRVKGWSAWPSFTSKAYLKRRADLDR